MKEPWIANRGRADAENWKPDDNSVAISISELGSGPARLSGEWFDVLRLQFQDWDSMPWPDGTARRFPKDAILMTEAQAAQVALFARVHRGRNILVHCSAGVSRSGGIVEALLDAFPEYYDEGQRRFPNGHVKALTKRALGLVPIGATEVS